MELKNLFFFFFNMLPRGHEYYCLEFIFTINECQQLDLVKGIDV